MTAWLHGSHEELVHAVMLVLRLTPWDQELTPLFVGLCAAPENHLRLTAATALMRLGTRNDDVRKALAALAEDRDLQVRITAIIAQAGLGLIDKTTGVNRVESLAVGDSYESVLLASGALLTIDEPDAAVRILSHSTLNPADAEAIFERALWVGAGAAAIPQLVQGLHGETTEQLKSLQRLAAIGETARESAPEVRMLLASASGKVRMAAIDALGLINAEPDKCAAALVPLLDAAEQGAAVAVALSRLHAEMETAMPILLRCIADVNQSVDQRNAAISGMAEYGPAVAYAAPHLIPSLKEAATQEAAKRALRRMGEVANPFLVPLLDDADPAIRSAAGEAITWTEAIASPRLRSACRDSDVDILLSMASISSKIRLTDPETIDAILRALDSPSRPFRESATFCLCLFELPDQRVIETMIPILDRDPNSIDDHEASAVHLAIGALGAIGTPARPAYELIERYAHRQYCEDAVPSALCRIDAKRGIESVKPLLHSPNWAVRQNALLALQHLGPFARPRLPEIKAALKHPVGIERIRAAAAWRHIEPENSGARRALQNAILDARWSRDESGFSFAVALYALNDPLLAKDCEQQVRQWQFDTDLTCATAAHAALERAAQQ